MSSILACLHLFYALHLQPYIYALQKPCQENFGKFQASGESRFGSSEKDRYLLKILKWQQTCSGLQARKVGFLFPK